METWVNNVFEGDCLELLHRLPDRFVDMVLCDLPYGMTQNPWDDVIDLHPLWQQYERIVKDNSPIVLTGQGSFTGKLIMSNPALFRYKLVWIKAAPTNFLNAKRQPLRRHEDVCIFCKGRPVYHPQLIRGKPYDKGTDSDKQSGSYGKFQKKRKRNYSGARYPTDVLLYEEEPGDDWVYFKGALSEGPVYHPNQKPVALGRYLIRTYSEPGAIILDNACGSGSFLVAAILEGRQFIGMEKNQHSFRLKNKPVDFITVCNNRIEKATIQRSNESSMLTLF
jgi:site-specific DNA-methyltransferase (adenine-specific)